MSTLARSRHGHRPRAHRTSIFGAREYSGRLGATRHHMAHHAAMLARGMPINTGKGSATSAFPCWCFYTRHCRLGESDRPRAPEWEKLV